MDIIQCINNLADDKLRTEGDTVLYDEVRFELKNTKLTVSDSYKSEHFKRVVEKKNLLNDINELITFLLTSNVYEYCTECADQLEYDTGSVSVCQKCKNKINNYVCDNYVTDSYKADPIVFEFIISSLWACITGPRRDMVLCEEKEYVTSASEPDYKKFDTFSDKDLLSHISGSTYSLIKCALNNVFYDMASIRDDDGKDFSGNNFVIQLSHSPEKEEEFKNVTSYLYHGSPFGNWYSLIKNGIKNYSGTKLMSHGAAYGNGVYLTDSLQLASSYGSRGGKKTVVGVVKIRADKSLYHKGGNVFVVPDDSLLLLSYIIITNGGNSETLARTVTKVEKTHNDCKIRTTVMTAKRISREVGMLEKRLKKSDGFKSFTEKSDYTVEFDLMGVVFEIRFPYNYPCSPPRCRITNVVVDNRKVTQKGNVLIPSFYKKNWKCGIKLVSIVPDLLQVAGSKIIENKMHTHAEADEEYKNIMRLVSRQ